MTLQPVTVLLADNDAMTRQCLRRAIEADPQLRVHWEADNGLQALLLAKKYRPQVVLLDAQMPRMDGIEATRCLRQHDPEVRILVMSVYDAVREPAFAAGADAFMTKDSGCEAIRQAIYRALASLVTHSRESCPSSASENEAAHS